MNDDTRYKVEEGLQHLVSWAAEISFGDIPVPVLRHAALIIGDDLAAMIAARDEPEIRCVHERLAGNATTREATIFCGRDCKTDRFTAAVANAIAGTWCELDEGFATASCHGGLYTVPAVVAEAEAEGIEARHVLRAVVLGYEIAARFARVWRFPRFTVHPHAAYAAIGAAAAAAALKQLDSSCFFAALTAASTLISAGSYDHAIKGAMVRNVWAAHGVWNGMRCVEWAQCGITGATSSPYDVYTNALGVVPEVDWLIRDLGTDWMALGGFHKIHACCHSAHTVVDAVLALFPKLPEEDRTKTIDRIVVDTPRLEMNNTAPANTLAAMFSIPQIVAATLVFGHAGAEAFASRSLNEPNVVRLRNRVQLRPYIVEPGSHAKPARVTLVLGDGTTITEEREEPLGNPKNPFPEEVVKEKIAQLTRSVYPRMAAEVESLCGLDEACLSRSWKTIVQEMTKTEP